MRRHLCAGLRTLLASLAALVVLAGAVASVALADAPPPAAAGAASRRPANWAPVHAGDFPDPSVMDWLGTYYGFATQNFATASQTINIQVSTSSDGVDWSLHQRRQCAAHRRLVGRAGNTWAAAVSCAMAPTTTSSCTTRRRTSRPATSASVWRPPSCPGPRSRTTPRNPWTAERGRLQRPDGRQHRGPRRQHRPGHLHRLVREHLRPDLEERRQSASAPPRPATLWAVPLAPSLLTHGQRPTDAAPDRRRRVAERHHRGSRHGRDLDDDGQHDDEQLHPLLFGQRPGLVHLCHRLGQLPLRSRRRLHRRVDVRTAAHHVVGRVRSRRPRRLRPARRGPSPRNLSWPSPAGRGRRSATSTAASVPCTWPTSTSIRAAAARPSPGSRRPTPTRHPPRVRRARVAVEAGAWILASGIRRRHLQLRRRPVLRLDRFHAPQQARGRHGGDARRQRLLAGGERRRSVRLRRRAVLRVDGEHHAQQADHRHDPHSRRRGLLVDRQRRRGVRVRRRQVLRLHRGRQSGLPDHRRRAELPRRRLLARRRQRPGLQLRRRAERGSAHLRTGWLPHHRHGGHAELERLLAGQRERQRGRLRRCGALRLHGRHHPERADRGDGRQQ